MERKLVGYGRAQGVRSHSSSWQWTGLVLHTLAPAQAQGEGEWVGIWQPAGGCAHNQGWARQTRVACLYAPPEAWAPVQTPRLGVEVGSGLGTELPSIMVVGTQNHSLPEESLAV